MGLREVEEQEKGRRGRGRKRAASQVGSTKKRWRLNFWLLRVRSVQPGCWDEAQPCNAYLGTSNTGKHGLLQGLAGGLRRVLIGE